jgi:hypothetical protein
MINGSQSAGGPGISSKGNYWCFQNNAKFQVQCLVLSGSGR